MFIAPSSAPFSDADIFVANTSNQFLSMSITLSLIPATAPVNPYDPRVTPGVYVYRL